MDKIEKWGGFLKRVDRVVGKEEMLLNNIILLVVVFGFDDLGKSLEKVLISFI